MLRLHLALAIAGLLARVPPSRAEPAEGEPLPARPALRYSPRPAGEARQWQARVRAELSSLLQLDDLLSARQSLALEPVILGSEDRAGYRLQEVEIRSTAARTIRLLVTLPEPGAGRPAPAVVCIHGHGGDRRSVHDEGSIYKGFAAALAGRGFVTGAADVGQHEVYEPGRTLMGERLWDLTRCVDYLASLDAVDSSRIGCAGLSLGGEMAMWLGAMDPRIAATVSSGFLTMMDQMESNHCLCWKFPGLRERVDFPDIYSLIAPRPLQCQNGLREDRTQFYVPLARQAMAEILPAYRDLGAPDAAALDVHDGGHEIDLPALLAFLETHLQPGALAAAPAAGRQPGGPAPSPRRRGRTGRSASRPPPARSRYRAAGGARAL